MVGGGGGVSGGRGISGGGGVGRRGVDSMVAKGSEGHLGIRQGEESHKTEALKILKFKNVFKNNLKNIYIEDNKSFCQCFLFINWKFDMNLIK
jgi:hypothetical protein